MEKEFLPYELSVKLKELGFNERQLGFSYIKFQCEGTRNAYIERVVPNYLYKAHDLLCTAPLWQQAFDWFREKHGVDSCISNKSVCKSIDIWRVSFIDFKNSMYDSNFRFISSIERQTYEEARQACLEKLIELVK